MFNIGGGEFVVIALIALLVLGPQRLPEAARQVGKAVGEIRRVSSGFQNELRGALNDADRAKRATPPRDVLAAGQNGSAPPAPAAATDGSAPPAGSPPRPPRKAPLRAAPPSKAAGSRAKRP